MSHDHAHDHDQDNDNETRREREARLARNEHLFRMLNENIAESAKRVEIDPMHLFEFRCECARIDCMVQIELTTTEYLAVREVADHFVLRPGHEMEEIERVIRREPRFWVVAKIDFARAVAVTLAEGGETAPH